MNWTLLVDVLKNGLLITGLVTVMMLMIEFINVSSHGKWFERLKGAPNKQVFLGTLWDLSPDVSAVLQRCRSIPTVL